MGFFCCDPLFPFARLVGNLPGKMPGASRKALITREASVRREAPEFISGEFHDQPRTQ
jgi:hypothetical protein